MSNPANWVGGSTPSAFESIIIDCGSCILNIADITGAYGVLTTNGHDVQVGPTTAITFSGLDATLGTVIEVRGSLSINVAGQNSFFIKDISELQVLDGGTVNGTIYFWHNSRFLNQSTSPLNMQQLTIRFYHTSEFKNESIIETTASNNWIGLNDSSVGLNYGTISDIILLLNENSSFINYGIVTDSRLESRNTSQFVNATNGIITDFDLTLFDTTEFINSIGAKIDSATTLQLIGKSKFQNFGLINIHGYPQLEVSGTFINDSSGVTQVTYSRFYGGSNFINRGTFISKNGTGVRFDIHSLTDTFVNCATGKMHLYGSSGYGMSIIHYAAANESFHSFGVINLCNNNQDGGGCPIRLSIPDGNPPVPQLVNHNSGIMHSDVDIEGSACPFSSVNLQNDGVFTNSCLIVPNINCPVEYTAVHGNILQGTVTISTDYETDGFLESIQSIGMNMGATVSVTYNSASEINLLEGFELLLGNTFETLNTGCMQ